MKLKVFVFALLLCFSLASNAQQEPTQEQVKTEMENGIVSFVNGVRSALPSSNYGNFEEFKLQLIGEANLSTITTEGNSLLKTTYELIRTNASEADIKERGWKAFGDAASIVLQYEKDHEYLSGNLTNGSIYLWGGHIEGVLSASQADSEGPGINCGDYRQCKWYQIGCHMHNLAVFICQAGDFIIKLILILK